MSKQIKHIIAGLWFLSCLGVVQGQILVKNHQITIVNDTVTHTLDITQQTVIELGKCLRQQTYRFGTSYYREL